MNNKRVLFMLLSLLIVLLLLSAGYAAAQDGSNGGERQPAAPEAPELSSNYIPIQGQLLDSNGDPLDGDFVATFRFYGVFTEGTPFCEVSRTITVDQGLFSTFVDGSGCRIDGRALYLGVQVEGDEEMTPRMYVDNVPYAWSLRPGAVISSSLNNGSILHIENWGETGRGLRSYAMATSSVNYGIVGASRSPDGYGGFFYNNGGGIGLSGQTDAASGAGVLASGIDSGADLILGGNANTGAGDDGIITSDPNYASSDMVLKVNDTLRIDLDNDADGEDADFEIRNGADALIFDVDESGAVIFGGAGIAAFPRPAYDSGLVGVTAGGTQTLNHGLGGNIDNYVVDLTCQHATYGRHIWGLGGDVTAGGFYGVFWRNLTTSAITVERATNDGECPQVRVRIWMYP